MTQPPSSFCHVITPLFFPPPLPFLYLSLPRPPSLSLSPLSFPFSKAQSLPSASSSEQLRMWLSPVVHVHSVTTATRMHANGSIFPDRRHVRFLNITPTTRCVQAFPLLIQFISTSSPSSSSSPYVTQLCWQHHDENISLSLPFSSTRLFLAQTKITASKRNLHTLPLRCAAPHRESS